VLQVRVVCGTHAALLFATSGSNCQFIRVCISDAVAQLLLPLRALNALGSS
jgi:hypothetical protein